MQNLEILKLEVETRRDTEAVFKVEHKWLEISPGARRAVVNYLGRKIDKLGLDIYLPELSWLSSNYLGRDKFSFKLASPFKVLLGILTNEFSKFNMKKLLCGELKTLKSTLYENSKTKGNTFYVKFTRDVNWEPGTFGEKTNSCLWGGRNVARAMIAANKGFAIQFFYDENCTKPFGRCWGVFIKNIGLVIWNPYNKETNNDIDEAKNSDWLNIYAMMLARVFKTNSRKIKLLNNNAYAGNFYINRGEGYLISTDRILKYNDSVDFEWSEKVTTFTCNDCNSIIPEANLAIETGTNRIICQKCADTKYGICMFNMALYQIRYLVKGPDGLVYFNDNLGKVKKFVYSSVYSEYILRNSSKTLGLNAVGDELFLKIDDMRVLCRHCKMELIPNTQEICMACEYESQYVAKKLDKLYFIINDSGTSWTTEVDKKLRYRILGG